MDNPEILTIYGTTWCADCRRAIRFYDQHQIPYQWIDIDQDREAEQLVRQVNRGNRSVPTILYPDGTILVEPTDVELKKKMTADRNKGLPEPES